MGVTIAIRARDQDLRKRMVKFMAEHHRKWADVIGSGGDAFARPGLGEAGELDYDHDKDAIGFDYSAGCYGWEKCLVFCETRWMALKVGRLQSECVRECEPTLTFEKPVPFVVYDGCEEWPIIVVKNLEEALALPKDRRWCAADDLGVYIGPEVNGVLTHFAERLFQNREAAEALNADLSRISNLCEGTREERARFREEHQRLMIKHVGPEIRETLPIIRREVERLDALWQSS